MIILEWFIGFYRPRFRDTDGAISPALWLGHCEVWGYTEDETWLFLDPQRKGLHVRVTHHYHEVSDALALRAALCDTILRVRGGDPEFALPMHGVMTCASLVGGLMGLRALFPWTLRRKLLAKGAKVIHETTERRSSRRGRSKAGSGRTDPANADGRS